MSKIPVIQLSGGIPEMEFYFSRWTAPKSSNAYNWKNESCVQDNPNYTLPAQYSEIYFLCGFRSYYHRGKIVKDVMTLEDSDTGAYIMLDDQRRLRCMGTEETGGAIMYVMVIP